MASTKRFRRVKELKKVCFDHGFELNSDKYDREGSDYVGFHFMHGSVRGHALVSTINGRVFGTFTDKKGRKEGDDTKPVEKLKEQQFSSDSTRYDGHGWFDELLDIVYTDDPPVDPRLKQESITVTFKAGIPSKVVGLMAAAIAESKLVLSVTKQSADGIVTTAVQVKTKRGR